MAKPKYTYMRKLPSNYYYWLFVLANAKNMDAFLLRGKEAQIKSLKSVLVCLKKQNNEKYLELNGEELEKRVAKTYTKFK